MDGGPCGLWVWGWAVSGQEADPNIVALVVGLSALALATYGAGVVAVCRMVAERRRSKS